MFVKFHIKNEEKILKVSRDKFFLTISALEFLTSSMTSLHSVKYGSRIEIFSNLESLEVIL